MEKNILHSNTNFYAFFEEIKQNIETRWIYLNKDILDACAKSKTFKGYTILSRYENDKSETKLLMLSLEKDNKSLKIFLKRCIMQYGYTYYIIYKIRDENEEKIAPCDPCEILFYSI